jgi:SAM-dependent methyltransferase
MFKSLFINLLKHWFQITQAKINIWMLHDKIRFYQKLFSGNILDVGAGSKPYRKLFTEATQYVGTNTLRHYQINRLQPDEDTTDVWIEDGTELPFHDATFDGVVCFQVFPLIARPDKFFQEVNRVLKPHGYFMMSSDYLYPSWSEEDYMRHSQTHLVKLAMENGFTVFSTESFGGILTTIYSMIIRYIRSYPERISRASHPLLKLWRTLWLLFFIIISPMSLILGSLLYFFERNKRQEYNYTMNLLIVMRKNA